MPIYEYRCRKCGQEFERIVANEREIVVCAKCGAEKPERLLSSFAVSGGGGSKGACGPSSPT